MCPQITQINTDFFLPFYYSTTLPLTYHHSSFIILSFISLLWYD
ncbi:MAG: hypothetical protein NT166_01140 [Candidatus Aminicenantes bacterium]|nr:hypothetical protein [Candidatus Aminicenantes bacterium]